MTRPLRLLVVPKWYPWPDRPVFGAFCREHARALATRHEVVVLASEAVPSPGFRAFELTDAMEDDLRTMRLRYRRPRFRPAAMGFQLAGMLVALRRLRRSGFVPQVVHAHVYSAGLPALILGRLCRAKVVITEHYTGFQRGLITGYDRLVARLAFRGADLVAPVSRDLGEHVAALSPSARLRVMPNTVDTRVFFPPPEAPTGSPRLLNVAALAEKKGHAHLLEALARLREERALSLDIAGDGELREELERRAAQLGLEDAVRFRGAVPRDEVAELMRGSHLFVLPSLFENLPVVLIEAMACGLPAVASRVGGVPELLDGQAGLLVPPGDPEALARAIGQALDSLERFDPAALAGTAAERYGYEAFAGSWTALYDELVA